MFHFSSACYNVINWFPPLGRLCVAKTSLFVTCSIATRWVEVAIALLLRATLPQLAKVIFNETPPRGVVKVNQALEKVKKNIHIKQSGATGYQGRTGAPLWFCLSLRRNVNNGEFPDPMSDLECSSSQIDGVYFSWYRTGKKIKDFESGALRRQDQSSHTFTIR